MCTHDEILLCRKKEGKSNNATTWMNPEDTMLSGGRGWRGSQEPKDNTIRFYQHEMHRGGKFIAHEYTMVAARGWEERGVGTG